MKSQQQKDELTSILYKYQSYSEVDDFLNKLAQSVAILSTLCKNRCTLQVRPLGLNNFGYRYGNLYD